MDINNFTFVTVVYNNYIDTFDFINSIKKLIKPSIEFNCVIVDNSDDPLVREIIDKIPLQYPFVKILRPENNLGYFGAFNFYFKNFSVLSGEIVVLCNNDLVFSDDFFQKFSSRKYFKDVFVVCPDVVTIDGIHQNPHVLKPRTKLQRIKLDLYFSSYYVACCLRVIQRIIRPILGIRKDVNFSSPTYIHMGIGACYILLPEFLSRFRCLDFPHFLYGEEAYLTRQVHSAGGKLYYDPVLKVMHKESATLSKLPKRTIYNLGRDGYWSYRLFY